MRVFYQMIGQLKEEMTEKKENVNHHLILIIFVIKSSFSNFHVIIFIVIRRHSNFSFDMGKSKPGVTRR